jgi:Tfp pilus assembly protein PilF
MKESKPLFTNDLFKQAVALLLALVAIQSTVLGFWKGQVVHEMNVRQRFTLQNQVQSNLTKNIGQVKTSAYLKVYERWLEMNTIANQEFESGDEEAAQRYWWIADRVLANLSPVMVPPYFNFYESGASGEFMPPDFLAYESDTYITSTALNNERVVNNNQVYEQLKSKRVRFTDLAIVLAIGLFLLGNSLKISAVPRSVMASFGLAIIIYSLAQMVIVQIEPTTDLPDDAMTAYAEGVGRQHKGDLTQAIVFYSEAINLAPEYYRAYHQRGIAYNLKGDLQSATTDFETAAENNRNDTRLLADLASAFYRQGHFNESVELWQHAAEIGDEITIMSANFNLGLCYLALGQAEDAIDAYINGILQATQIIENRRAAGKEISGSEWWLIDQAATELDFLISCWEEQHCDGTPPYENVSQQATLMKPLAVYNSTRLKEAIVALEFAIDLSAEQNTNRAKVNQIEFYTVFEDASGAPIDTQEGYSFSDEIDNIIVGFPYEGFQSGQIVLMKVYVNGQEAPSLRLLKDWPSGAVRGVAEFPINSGGLKFDSGQYWVEIYVDAHLIQQDGFEVTPSDNDNPRSGLLDPITIEQLMLEAPPNPREGAAKDAE